MIDLHKGLAVIMAKRSCSTALLSLMRCLLPFDDFFFKRYWALVRCVNGHDKPGLLMPRLLRGTILIGPTVHTKTLPGTYFY